MSEEENNEVDSTLEENRPDQTIPMGNSPVDPDAPTDFNPKLAVEMADEASVRLGWTPPSPEELDPLFPDYKIIELIGRGGMGAVYKGIQKSLDRLVAIKLLPPELGATPEFEARFKREAKSMAKLNHPNIVQIYDFGQTDGGHFYFVMEFVEGSDLNQFIRDGNLNVEGALNAVSQICDALQYAHDKGFVHRDIKPANIFLNTEGTLKVGDFGLAKLVDEGKTGEHGTSPTEKMGLTMTGVAMGTLHYIAPEQLADGTDVDHRADIYSLGIMFYEMLTGEVPRGAVREPSKKVKRLDVRVDGVVYKAMEANRNERYQSAIDIRTDVDLIRATPVVETGERKEEKETTKAVGFKVAMLMASLVLLLGGGGLLYMFSKKNSDTPRVLGVRDHFAGNSPKSPVSFPLPDPIGYPPLPTRNCRFVIFPREDRIEEPLLEAVSAIRNDDFSDLVSLSKILNNRIGGIRSNGLPVFWKSDGKKVEINEKALHLCLGFVSGFWIKPSGEIGTSVDMDDELQAEFNALGPVSYVSESIGGVFIITKDGKRHLIGKFAHHPNVKLATEELQDIHAISFAGNDFIQVLDRQGTFWDTNERMGKVAALKNVCQIVGPSIFRQQNGSLVSHQQSISVMLEKENTWEWCKFSNNLIVGKNGNGLLRIYNLSEGPIVRETKLEKALEGGTEIQLGKSFICALLPSNTVPRSGLWDVDELIAAREKIERELEGGKTSGNEKTFGWADSPALKTSRLVHQLLNSTWEMQGNKQNRVTIGPTIKEAKFLYGGNAANTHDVSFHFDQEEFKILRQSDGTQWNGLTLEKSGDVILKYGDVFMKRVR